jgi:hypothetical protein
MTDQQGDRAATHGGSGGGLGRAAKRLVTLMVAGLLLGACGGGSSAGSQVGTETGLVDVLAEVNDSYVSVDFEAMHRMQEDGCDYSLEEVTEGFQQVQAFFLAFFGSTFGDVLADTEFEIASFDEESLTAIVMSTYVGDNPALASDDEDLVEFRFVDGSWTSDGDCLGAGVQAG